MSEPTQNSISCRDWKAYHDHQPGPGATPVLRVTGICTFNEDGHVVTLEPARTGINPDIFMMRLRVDGPDDGGTAKVISDEPVHYELPTSQEYKQVHIIDVAVIDVEELER